MVYTFTRVQHISWPNFYLLSHQDSLVGYTCARQPGKVTIPFFFKLISVYSAVFLDINVDLLDLVLQAHQLDSEMQ